LSAERTSRSVIVLDHNIPEHEMEQWERGIRSRRIERDVGRPEWEDL